MAEPTLLLQTKLRVPRPRLHQLLDRGQGLTLVSAPARFGKSTLLAGGWRPGPDRAAWLSLDSADNDPVFWTYLIAAVRTVARDAGTAALDMLPARRRAAGWAASWKS